jgi:hypothetical protein
MPLVNYSMMASFKNNGDGSCTWKGKTEIFKYNNVILNITAARFQTERFFAAGMDIDFVFSRKQKENMINHGIPSAITEVLNFGTVNIGELPFSGDDGRLTMLVHSGISGGYGFALPGVVQWPEQSFSPDNLNDPLAGAGAAEMFVHEVFHLWWGMLVQCENDGLWSNEGLTVYMTYRFMKNKYGELYAKNKYIDKWQAQISAQERSFYNRRPEYLEKLPASYRMHAENIKNINRYNRMPLIILEIEKIIGREKLDVILKNIILNYKDYNLENLLTYNNFLLMCGLNKEDISLD